MWKYENDHEAERKYDPNYSKTTRPRRTDSMFKHKTVTTTPIVPSNITLRQFYAGLAMHALMQRKGAASEVPYVIALKSFAQADAMLKFDKEGGVAEQLEAE